jgi:hypothetical protein
MAAGKRRTRASLEASRSRENDCVDEVSADQTFTEGAATDERQTRERLVEYFAILREWDLKLRQKESQDVPVFRPS